MVAVNTEIDAGVRFCRIRRGGRSHVFLLVVCAEARLLRIIIWNCSLPGLTGAKAVIETSVPFRLAWGPNESNLLASGHTSSLREATNPVSSAEHRVWYQ